MRPSAPDRPLSERRRQAPRLVDQPTVGFFLVRLVKGGPLIPAEITCRDGRWAAIINGEERPGHTDPLKAEGVAHVYLGQTISEAEYRRRLKLKDIPGHPAATPDKPIDLTKIRSIF